MKSWLILVVKKCTKRPQNYREKKLETSKREELINVAVEMSWKLPNVTFEDVVNVTKKELSHTISGLSRKKGLKSVDRKIVIQLKLKSVVRLLLYLLKRWLMLLE